MQLLRNVADGDTEFMNELVELYFADTSNRLVTLRQAVTSGAVSEVERIAHTLAGASIASGMRAVAPPLRKLERMARAGQLVDAATLVEEAATQLNRTRDFLASALLNDSEPVAIVQDYHQPKEFGGQDRSSRRLAQFSVLPHNVFLITQLFRRFS